MHPLRLGSPFRSYILETARDAFLYTLTKIILRVTTTTTRSEKAGGLGTLYTLRELASDISYVL